MTKESLTVAAVMSAPPREVYEAWLDSITHTRMTGGAASIDPKIGGRHTAWDGYIQGRTLELEPPARIVQTWRSSEFPEDAEDSLVEITFEPHGDGARVVIVHTDIPVGQGDAYHRGWHEHYFEPMSAFFRARVRAALEWEPPESTPETIRADAPAEPARARPKRPAKRKTREKTPAKKATAKKAAKKATAKKAAPKKAIAKKRAAKSSSKKASKKSGTKPSASRSRAKKAPAKAAAKKKIAKRPGAKKLAKRVPRRRA